MAELEGVFRGFSPAICSILAESGMTRPTPPQEKAIPLIEQGRNTLVVSPTGSGKTEAVLLPILDRMVREGVRSKAGVLLLYITPLRALNRDLLDRATFWCKSLDIRLAVRHGDTETADRRAQTMVPPQVLITTPETLEVLLVAKVFREHLRSLRWVVVDEIHELATDKRGTQLAVSLERLRRLTDADFQRVGLSATVGNPEMISGFLVGPGRDCEIVKTPVAKLFKFEVLYPSAELQDEARADRMMSHPEVAARLRTILRLIDEGPLLIFTNTRTEAEILTSRLRQWSPRIAVAAHHGSLSRESRSKAEEDLKTGRLKAVVCTSSLELGIDVGLLNLVIQYNSPRQVVRLIQRAGRSGHTLERTSRCVIICQDADDALESAVIGRRAKEELLEEPLIHTGCGDVLVQQLAGLLIESGRMETSEALAVFRRSFPFASLEERGIREAVDYMATLKPKLARAAGDDLARPSDKRGLFRYYFDNLTMIPEQRQYPVVTEEKEAVGLLDEEFVAEHGEIGKKFILRGSVWKINQVYNSRVYVEEDDDPLGAIPSWVGEEIPVPTEVAMEVGHIRGLAARSGPSGIRDLCMELSKRYPMEVEGLQRSLVSAAQQSSMGMAVPSDEVITIERWRDVVTLVTHRGLKANRTLGRLLSHRCSAVLGKPVSVNQDAYRIFLEGKELTCEAVRDAIATLSGSDVQSYVTVACEDTGLFRRRFVHVARKMGVLSRDAELTSALVKQLVETYKDSLPYKEAWRTFLLEDLDVRETSNILAGCAAGRVAVEILGSLSEPSPISMIGLEEMSRKGEVMDPARMKRLLIESARSRVLNGRTTLVCMSCWDFVEERYIVDLPEKILCPRCGSEKVAATFRPTEEAQELARKSRSHGALSRGALRFRRELEGSSKLMSAYGTLAVKAQVFNIALPRLAEMLSRSPGNEDDFLLTLMEEERKTYLKRFAGTR
ncbi:MAG TPA: DEAD/DEAH box helicase [Conexivisphaerales archaeon]|nr:DEAD/DEAH box helicase [Conexivisphaerales archaeon]